MALFIYEQFLKDLLTEVDAKFPRRVLSKVLDARCNFLASRDDHQYDGIPGGWIRYVSMGGAAIRVIYIRKGPDVYLYRAGPHSVEDGLTAPKAGEEVVHVVPTSAALAKLTAGSGIPPPSRLLENYRPEFIRTKLLSRRFAKHKSIVLISPYVSPDLFLISSPFWRVLQDLSVEGTNISIITRAPASMNELKFFERLEAEGVDILFHNTVHAKLYLFEADPDLQEEELKGLERKMALIGSANMTIDGFAIGATPAAVSNPNEELVFELSKDHYAAALDYATYLTLSASDIPRQRVVLTRLERRSVLNENRDSKK